MLHCASAGLESFTESGAAQTQRILALGTRVLLNPCDYLFYGQHQLLTKKSPEGNIAYMVLDLEGHLEPSVFREALVRAMIRHPAMLARFRVSFPLGRPYWKTPRDAASQAQRAAEQAHVYSDLRADADWEQRIARLYPGEPARRWNHRVGPQVRFEQYALPDGRTRFIFRWPHFLMDADGAQWFLVQIGGQRLEDLVAGASTSPELPEALCADYESLDILKQHSFWQRVRLFRRGLAAQQTHGQFKISQLVKPPPGHRAEHEAIYRNYSAEQTLHIQESAKHAAPSGPALYARFSAACVMQAIHRLFLENGSESEAYYITMPLRAGVSQHDTGLFSKRPVPGNFLVSPILYGMREKMGDKQAIGEDIFKQLQEYLSNQIDMAQWAMMWAASYIHEWTYRLIFKLPLDIGEFASGFSYYGEISEPVRTLCGARVLNLWGGGPTTTPPALNPVFSKFENRLNLSLTYDRKIVSDAMAQRYVELIEEQLFEPPLQSTGWT